MTPPLSKVIQDVLMHMETGQAGLHVKLPEGAFLLVFLLGWEQSSIIILLPVIIDITGLKLTHISLIILVELVVLIPSGPLWGRFSDQRGRQAGLASTTFAIFLGQLIIASTIMLAAWGMLTAFAIWACLLLGRLVFASGSSGIMPIVQASLADRLGAAPSSAELARIAMILNIGRLFGPIVGSALLLFAPILVFWLPSFLTASALIIQRNRGVEAKPAVSSHDTVGIIFPLPTRAIIGLLSLSFLVVLGVRQIQFLLGPLVQSRLAQSPEEAGAVTGMVLTSATLAAIATQCLIMPHLARRRSSVAFMLGGSGLMTGSLLIMTFSGLAQLLAGGMILAAALACLVPTYTSLLIAKDKRAATVGLLATAQIAGSAFGASLGSLLFSLSESLPFLLSTVSALLVLALAMRIPTSSTKHHIENENHSD